MRTPAVADKFGAGEPPVANLRHYFFDMGNDSTIAFFEYPKSTPQANRDLVGTMQHCAFHVSRRDFEAAMARLKAAGVPYTGPIDRKIRHSIYFYDNNGIRLEFTTFLAPQAQQGRRRLLQHIQPANGFRIVN